MAKSIMQFRYYVDGSNTNQPSKLKKSALISGSLFEPYYPIVSLKIRGPEGLGFYINGNNQSVKLGPTGYYELDVSNLGVINQLSIQKDMDITSENPLIIDIIYEKE